VFWIAQNGQDLGQCSAADLISMWAKGELGATASYWLPGMAEWRSLEEIMAYEAPESTSAPDSAPAAVAEPAAKPGGKKPNKNHLNFLARRGIATEGLTRDAAAQLVEKTKEEEKLQRNLATPRQRACLEYHGIEIHGVLTKDEASAIMDGIDFSNSKWMQERHVKYPDLYDSPTLAPMSERQRAFLDYHGIEYDGRTSGQEASAMIQEVIDDPAHDDSGWNERKYEVYPHLFNDDWQ